MPPRGPLPSSRDILMVTSGRNGATGIQQVETRDAAEHPATHRTAPTTTFLAQMSIALRLRNPVLEEEKLVEEREEAS